ncbi:MULTISPECIES: hypothetical protein [unclassified Micromonospora]|nr:MULTISPECIES: hypothetical protein [unclassified Micromonospora]MDG4820208.1 hypothetical protein [Micromonospora sp. WMMD956]WFE56601.1 hypothetical protein O7633_06780 [Micromonospora sp. WMMD712]
MTEQAGHASGRTQHKGLFYRAKWDAGMVRDDVRQVVEPRRWP